MTSASRRQTGGWHETEVARLRVADLVFDFEISGCLVVLKPRTGREQESGLVSHELAHSLLLGFLNEGSRLDTHCWRQPHFLREICKNLKNKWQKYHNCFLGKPRLECKGR